MGNLFEPRPIDPYLIAEKIATYNPEEEARKEKIMKNCSHIEYEQDMGAHIPFCKLDGQMCNMQCLKNVLEPEEEGTDKIRESNLDTTKGDNHD